MGLVETVDELHELMKPYRVCVCDNPVEDLFIPDRFTYRCGNCCGVIPLRWAEND